MRYNLTMITQINPLKYKKNSDSVQAFPVPDPSLYPETVILDIETTGFYWRTTQITNLHLIISDFKNSQWQDIELTCEKESDEYDLLQFMLEKLDGISSIITYNGTTFDLPYLNHKLKAYALINPFTDKNFRDLMSENKELGELLHLASHKLKDYTDYFNISSGNDGLNTLSLLFLDTYRKVLIENTDDFKIEKSDQELLLTLMAEDVFPYFLKIKKSVFSMEYTNASLLVRIPIVDGYLRMYYRNYEDYYFLPAEGYAVHRSLSDFVEKSHRVKASPETCYTLIPFSEKLFENGAKLNNYCRTILKYLIF